jgi:hypothetical protein
LDADFGADVVRIINRLDSIDDRASDENGAMPILAAGNVKLANWKRQLSA